MNQFKKKRCKEQTYRRRGEKCGKKYVLILSVFFFLWWRVGGIGGGGRTE